MRNWFFFFNVQPHLMYSFKPTWDCDKNAWKTWNSFVNGMSKKAKCDVLLHTPLYKEAVLIYFSSLSFIKIKLNYQIHIKHWPVLRRWLQFPAGSWRVSGQGPEQEPLYLQFSSFGTTSWNNFTEITWGEIVLMEYELHCYSAVEKCALADSWLKFGSGESLGFHS